MYNNLKFCITEFQEYMRKKTVSSNSRSPAEKLSGPSCFVYVNVVPSFWKRIGKMKFLGHKIILKNSDTVLFAWSSLVKIRVRLSRDVITQQRRLDYQFLFPVIFLVFSILVFNRYTIVSANAAMVFTAIFAVSCCRKNL